MLEELALEVPAGPLVLTDWLPPWGGWDDALCLVFDGGVHPASITEQIVHQAREIRTAEFLDAEQVLERCADFTARRIASALGNLEGRAGLHRVRSLRPAPAAHPYGDQHPAHHHGPPIASAPVGHVAEQRRGRDHRDDGRQQDPRHDRGAA